MARSVSTCKYTSMTSGLVVDSHTFFALLVLVFLCVFHMYCFNKDMIIRFRVLLIILRFFVFMFLKKYKKYVNKKLK